MSGRGAALKAVMRPPIVTGSLVVAVIVGSVLNLINQGDVLIDGTAPDWGKLVLTYCVPFLVSSYGSYAALLSVGRGEPD